MSKDNGGPAFPYEHKFGDGTANRDDGMTLRDYFAIRCPDSEIGGVTVGDVKQYNSRNAGQRTDEQAIKAIRCQRRYGYADAMLLERAK